MVPVGKKKRRKYLLRRAIQRVRNESLSELEGNFIKSVGEGEDKGKNEGEGHVLV